ncbi:hypothetical protein Cni_G11446 [Canna indica]|uniref:Uncharacterized protein n=1 Tax=Canna indica TaxID=4628 RepID=A0AAQ3K6C5_9LILI|nr:hypothetical protein Cni_G11446 [Canna indica]
MADIALLVAEDFERRSKGWEKGDHGQECSHFLASFTLSALGREAREKASSFKGATAAKEEVVRAVKPRSSFGSAAFDGFFSA